MLSLQFSYHFGFEFYIKIQGRGSSRKNLIILTDLQDRGLGFKTGPRLSTFTKAVTEFSEPTYMLWSSHALTNSFEFRHGKTLKQLN
jgi:hypothetical protein